MEEINTNTTVTSPFRSLAIAMDSRLRKEAVHGEEASGATTKRKFMGAKEGSGTSGSGQLIKERIVKVIKRRGRPTKYPAKTDSVSMALSPQSPPAYMTTSSHVGSCEKRGRGRPRELGKNQFLASLGAKGESFTPHVMTVHSGEDVVGRILSFSHKGPRAICVLSAIGSVSRVTIHQPADSEATSTYEGHFEILSLSGSFTFAATGGGHLENGWLSVMLARPDGRVFGGVVVGSLIATSPIQLIVASFKLSVTKELMMRQLAINRIRRICQG